MRVWWHRLRYRECQVCMKDFRKHRVVMPSLVGFSYCSSVCEAVAWNRWITGTERSGR